MPAPEVVDLSFFSFSVPEDLSLEEREELLDIRRRKKELIDDIEVNKSGAPQCLDMWDTEWGICKKCGDEDVCEDHRDREMASPGC